MVQDAEEENIATQWIPEALGGDANQNRERIHLGEERDIEMVSTNVLCGSQNRGTSSAGSLRRHNRFGGAREKR